jgi:hypothetical protein
MAGRNRLWASWAWLREKNFAHFCLAVKQVEVFEGQQNFREGLVWPEASLG